MVEHLPSIVELWRGLAIVPCLHDDLHHHNSTPQFIFTKHGYTEACKRVLKRISQTNRLLAPVRCEVDAYLIQGQVLQRGSLNLVVQIGNVSLMMLTPVELQSLLCTGH